MEKPLFPCSYMRITQGVMEGTHKDSYAFDNAGKDTGIDSVRAPFTGVIKKIYPQDANEVWLESVDVVEYPDGTIDYMTMMFAHDNDISNLSVGQIIPRGTAFYEEGTKGNASGNHVHMECGRGKFTGTGWHKNNAGYWSINNGKHPSECLWIDDSITVLSSYGYQFKTIPVVKEEPKKETESTTPVQKEEPKKEEVKKTPTLIFTCKSDDLYAINLKKGEKLYLE